MISENIRKEENDKLYKQAAESKRALKEVQSQWANISKLQHSFRRKDSQINEKQLRDSRKKTSETYRSSEFEQALRKGERRSRSVNPAT